MANSQQSTCAGAEADYCFRMKFLMAILAYLVIGAVLGSGILLTVKGNPWLLIVGFLAYVVAFAKIGCLPGKSH
jgi:F0F1-type ATP synthase assembly protein I